MKRFRLFLAGIVVMAAVSGTQAAVVTDGFDFVENLVEKGVIDSAELEKFKNEGIYQEPFPSYGLSSNCK